MTLTLSTGRVVDAHDGVLGLTDAGDLVEGYDSTLESAWMPGTDDEEFTDAERVEIADAVIARWQAWRAQWVEKIASDAKHAARVEEARAAMQAGDWERFGAMVREDMAAEGVVEVAPAPATVAIGVFAGFQLVNLPGYR